MDIGAPTSTIGRNELNRIMSSIGRHKLPMEKSRRWFRFEGAVFESLGTVEPPLATPDGFPQILVVIDIVSADVPPLVVLDVFDDESIFADTGSNSLIKRVVTSK